MTKSKRAMAILFTSLILLAVPVLATAHDGYDRNSGHRRDSLTQERYGHGYGDRDHRYRGERYRHYKKAWQHKQYRHHLAERRYLHVPRRPQVVVAQPRITRVPAAAVLLGLPPIVLHIDW